MSLSVLIQSFQFQNASVVKTSAHIVYKTDNLFIIIIIIIVIIDIIISTIIQ